MYGTAPAPIMDHDDANRLFYAHVWPHRAMILRTAGFLAGPDADDLAQETLVKAFRSIHTFDTATNAKAWLSAILRNTWIDRMRAQGRQGGAVSVEASDLDLADERTAEADVNVDDPAALLERFTDAQMIAAL